LESWSGSVFVDGLTTQKKSHASNGLDNV